jgi:hypothetical protein
MMTTRTLAFAVAILLSGLAQPSLAEPPRSGAATADRSHATVTASLKQDLVGVGAIDGQPITDVKSSSRCETLFASKSASAVIHWAKVGNFAPRTSGATVSISIDDGGGPHQITMPANSQFRRVDGSLGLLADDCSGS